MAHTRIKCFVAMAFGRDDCDAIYDRQIVPVLRGLGIDAVRVDRRQHRDDLNVYIIAHLKEADLALVDLTYARPSVYYEAGFAERNIPVVYTVRKDHLRPGQPDEGLRIHFDLGMKKIVSWQDAGDPTFEYTLRQRVSYPVRPIRASRCRNAREEKDREAFSRLSVQEQCARVTKSFSYHFLSKHFGAKTLSAL